MPELESIEDFFERAEEQRQKAKIRYLPSGDITLPSRAPLFVERGHCQWCNKELTGKAKVYCRPTSEESYLYSGASPCAWHFLKWWCSRPAYVRATFIRDNFTCLKCGFHQMREDKPWLPNISQLEADHIVPVAKGGQTTMDNLQTLCTKCNRRKGTRKDVPPPKNQLAFELPPA